MTRPFRVGAQGRTSFGNLSLPSLGPQEASARSSWLRPNSAIWGSTSWIIYDRDSACWYYKSYKHYEFRTINNIELLYHFVVNNKNNNIILLSYKKLLLKIAHGMSGLCELVDAHIRQLYDSVTTGRRADLCHHASWPLACSKKEIKNSRRRY